MRKATTQHERSHEQCTQAQRRYPAICSYPDQPQDGKIINNKITTTTAQERSTYSCAVLRIVHRLYHRPAITTAEPLKGCLIQPFLSLCLCNDDVRIPYFLQGIRRLGFRFLPQPPEQNRTNTPPSGSKPRQNADKRDAKHKKRVISPVRRSAKRCDCEGMQGSFRTASSNRH